MELIVTHYKEPWSTVKKYFDMLDVQRFVDFSKIHVIFVNDGEEHSFPEEYFTERPYKVTQIAIPHSGVSAARNEGLRRAKAEWVMFCDCDDMFATPYAMMDLMDAFRNKDLTNKVDLIWSDFLIESKKNHIYSTQGFNMVFIHGKIFRRSYLIDNDIWFDEHISYCEDCLFVTTAYIMADEHRIARAVSRMPIYIWCDTDGSVTNTTKAKDDAPIATLYRNKKICELYKKVRPYDEYCCMVARTIIDSYYYFNRPNLSPMLTAAKNDFFEWYRDHAEQWKAVPKETLRVLKEKSKASLFIDKENVHEDISVTEWLRRNAFQDDEI